MLKAASSFGNATVSTSTSASGLISIPVNNALAANSSFGAGAGATFSNNSYGAPIGIAQACNMQTPINALGIAFANLKTIIYGTRIGIQFRKSPTPPPFSVMVDGVPYDIPLNNISPYFYNTVSVNDLNNFYVIISNLVDGPHSVLIVLPAAAAAQTVVVQAFLGEATAGYQPVARLDALTAPAQVTDVASVIPIVDQNSFAFKGIKKILYTNTDSSPRLVTIQYQGTAATATIWTLVLAAAGSDGASKSFDLTFNGIIPAGTVVGTTNPLSHLADVTAKVNFTVIGGE